MEHASNGNGGKVTGMEYNEILTIKTEMPEGLNNAG